MKAVKQTSHCQKEFEDTKMGSNTSRSSEDVQDSGLESRKLDEEVDQKSVHNLHDPEVTRHKKEELDLSLVGVKDNWSAIIVLNVKLLVGILELLETFDDPKASEDCERRQWEGIVAIQKELQARIKEATERRPDLKASKEFICFMIIFDELRVQFQNLRVLMDKISCSEDSEEEDTSSSLQEPERGLESMKRKLESLSLPEDFRQVLNELFGMKKTL